jgi:hypothetical protein
MYIYSIHSIQYIYMYVCMYVYTHIYLDAAGGGRDESLHRRRVEAARELLHLRLLALHHRHCACVRESVSVWV